MKKIIASVIALSMMATLVACGSSSSDSASGEVYTGVGTGFGGEIKVEMTIDGSTITNFAVVSHSETDGLGTVPIAQFETEIVSKQSVNLDIVAGATMSSNGTLEAAKNALEAAGLDVSDYMTAGEVSGEKTEETLEADIVVIGAGGAGLVSAIEATMAGQNVIVVEKMAFAGGNSIKATGGMNAAETYIQEALEIEDSVEVYIDDIMVGGSQINDIELVTTLAENSADAVEWLKEIGAPLSEESVTPFGGSTNNRTHLAEGGGAVGSYLVAELLEIAEGLDIEIIYNTQATEIVLNEDGVASGIVANSNSVDYTINASAVVLATGGFAANEEIYASYNPDLLGFVTTNHSGATGDGIALATNVGAGLTDIEEIQIHPTVNQETSIMITEGVRSQGGILVNQTGERIINELETRDVVSAAIMAEEEGYAYLIFDQALRSRLGATESYVKAGIVVEADTLEELAELIGADVDTLVATLDTWNASIEAGTDADFGRTTGMDNNLVEGPFYATQISPGVHHTMGGVSINTDANVVTESGDVIEGLFAAGEVTGGIHGAERLGGNAVTDFVVFGRISGASASNYVNSLN